MDNNADFPHDKYELLADAIETRLARQKPQQKSPRIRLGKAARLAGQQRHAAALRARRQQAAP